MGDMHGITQQLPYLKQLGVDAVWLSPFYKSPQADAGYDVADYRVVDPLFGNNEDFDRMLATAHGLGLKVIVDLVPNHTSDEHVWFQDALAAGPGSPERARYMFREGKGKDGDQAPNNWNSVFGGPAWTRVTEADGTPGEWYLHLFDTKQPDLNWENEEVRDEMRSVLRFWLDKGVDGFRVDVAHGLIKADGLPDWDGAAAMVEGSTAKETPADGDDDGGDAEPATEPTRAEGQDLSQAPFFDQDGVHEIYRDWHKVLESYEGDRMLVAEAWVEPAERLARYVRPDEMQQAFNFDFLLAGWDAERLAHSIDASIEAVAAVGAPVTWVLSNHDTVRHPSRFGLKDPATFPKGIASEDEQPDAALGLSRARAATLVELALPGSAYLYQGEELGLPEHTTLPASARQDPSFFRTHGAERGRDGCRVPLPWTADAPGYGFSLNGPDGDAQPWLPQPESFRDHAADVQDGVEGSTLELYRAALALRRKHRLGRGAHVWSAQHRPEQGLVAFLNGGVLVLANMGEEPVDLPVGFTPVLSSGPLTGGMLPVNTSAYLLPQA
ncbi:MULTISPECIES: glycoside hydrolase family 13 protein [Arthrobacter]|uniref:Glycoside hydrolase family 13 protein n=2 Tax=Arthrobacter TaxID=1663 RepID=A0ABU9KI35_9MICC|nr:glycoside hydrolase family 13 protein [Arthrobacter sp. YJM1]MDP5226429.1 glycoside hydrolase family 13 protein [Arthrobacter sp. YJM1]